MDPNEINLDDDDYVVIVISNDDEDLMPVDFKKEVKEEQETLDETFDVEYYDHQELDQEEFSLSELPENNNYQEESSELPENDNYQEEYFKLPENDNHQEESSELPENDNYQEEYFKLPENDNHQEEYFKLPENDNHQEEYSELDNDEQSTLKISEIDPITLEYLNKVKRNAHRKSHWKCVPLEYQHSYVEELRNQYPELRNDEEKLVAKLVEVMRNCTPEEPPEDFLTGSNTFECAICYYKSKTIGEAKRHYQWKHGPRYLSCYACGNDYRCSINLTKHEKKCIGQDAPIVMKARAICVGRRGFNRPFLDLSIREGTSVRKLRKVPGEKKKKYKCTREGTNVRTLKKVPGEKKKKYKCRSFDCTECTASFKTKQSFTAHVNLHKGLRPYQCEKCPMAYTSQVGLKHHLRIHKPATYICDICGFEFHYRNAIISHMNTHLPRRKYACTFPNCDRRFSQKSTLKVHMDVDHGNQPLPFGCNFCEKRCRRMTHLKEHMKKAHGMLLMTRTMFVRSLPKLDIQELTSIAAENVTEIIESV